MIIQINTDKNIPASQGLTESLTGIVAIGMERYSERLTRVEVHLSDEDGNKDGDNDIRCLFEARMNGRPPVAVSSRANTHEEAVEGAMEKIRSVLETTIGKLTNH